MRQQQVDQALKYQEIITNTQSKISEVNDRLVAAQVENANKDKEYLSERLSEAIAAANRPPSLQFDQVKGMIEAMRANDIPVQMGTSEDEKTKAQIEIEKLERYTRSIWIGVESNLRKDARLAVVRFLALLHPLSPVPLVRSASKTGSSLQPHLASRRGYDHAKSHTTGFFAGAVS